MPPSRQPHKPLLVNHGRQATLTAASRTQSVFKSKFQSLVVRRGHKRSIIALAHKLLHTIFFMLEGHEHYRDSATDYEALAVQRNAPRWIKALTRFEFIPAAA